MAVQLLRRLFTVEEYHRMAQAGILTEDDRLELIEGEIVEMAPIGSRHQSCVDRLAELFFRQVADRAIVRVQGPVLLERRSEPQPDLTLLRRRPSFYAIVHPGPEDVLLVVEVCDTTVDYDRQVKVPLYARYGIPEVWLVVLEKGLVEVYRKPTVQGYQEVSQARRGQRLSPEAFPDLELAVDDILG
jgi:Uma2 family endonuclease